MQPHEERVVAEKQELDEKLAKLKAFRFSSPVFKALPLAERVLLQDQHKAMARYSQILGQRIARFATTAIASKENDSQP